MAGVRVELLVLVLVVLTGTLLLVPVRGWELIDAAHLDDLNEEGQWPEPQSGSSIDTSTVNSSDLDGEDALPEAEAEAEGAGTGENVDPDRGFHVEFVDGPTSFWDSGANGGFQDFIDGPASNWDSGADGGFHMEFAGAPPRSWSTSTSPSSSGLDVVCTDVGFQITLLTGSLSDVKVLGSKEVLSVTDAPDYCGYEVNSFQNNLTVPFTGCHVKHADGYSLQLLYVDDFGQTQVATASCDESLRFDPGLVPRSSGQPKGTQKKCNTPTSPPSNCAVASGERLPCGQSGISSADCVKLGCCVDSSACYYPMDECTSDHFVFAIRHDSASIPVNPKKLVIPGNPNCKPVIVNEKVAIFKFKLTECGARNYMVGETRVYLAEVQTAVLALNLKFGIITRSDPLRFMVECRYSKTGTAHQSLASTGYMVMTPSSSLPSSVISNGLYGVQLRIAEDHTYSKYLPTNNQPLRVLLGNPVYLELRLKSPKPDAVVLVNYCLAYPRSAKNALVLIYEGCANPYDPHVSVLKVRDLPKNRHQRRFMVQAFQFMDQKTNKYLDEEIYFMCSTEVCRPTEKTCAERCFDGKAR